MSDVNRRDLLKYGAGIVAASAYAGLSGNLFDKDSLKTIRVAWIGTGGRGTGMLEVLLKTQDNVELLQSVTSKKRMPNMLRRLLNELRAMMSHCIHGETSITGECLNGMILMPLSLQRLRYCIARCRLMQ
jgi:hypothetical protein